GSGAESCSGRSFLDRSGGQCVAASQPEMEYDPGSAPAGRDAGGKLSDGVRLAGRKGAQYQVSPIYRDLFQWTNSRGARGRSHRRGRRPQSSEQLAGDPASENIGLGYERRGEWRFGMRLPRNDTEKVTEMKALKAQGWSYRAIGRRYGVWGTTVGYLVNDAPS